MSLEGDNIDKIKQKLKSFNNKCQYYYRESDTRDEVFTMTQGDNESLEDFVERLKLSYRGTQTCTLDPNSLKLVLLRGVNEYLMEIINLFSSADTYHLSYDDIKKVFKKHSKATRKIGRTNK